MATSSNTLVPSAAAKVSMRLAPDEDPREAFAAAGARTCARTRRGAPRSTCTSTTRAPASPPTRRARSTTQARAAFADAWGVPPVDIGVGGSIPFVAAFAEKFPDAAILVTGVEDPDTRAHGANESLHLGEFERVCVAEAVLLERLGALPR